MPKMLGPGRLAGQPRRLLRAGIWAGPVFAATFLGEGAVHEGYHARPRPAIPAVAERHVRPRLALSGDTLKVPPKQ
jgi:hypothetical protein